MYLYNEDTCGCFKKARKMGEPTKKPKISSTGLGMIGGIGGQVLGEFLNRAGEERQYERQRELNKQGQELAMKTWNETNYGAQMEHMKKAGLSPALMYGQSGAGGATTNAGSGGSAPQAKAFHGMGVMEGAQLGLLEAQKANIQADTENKKAGAGKATAEATKISGVDTIESRSRIAKLGAETSHEKHKEHLTIINEHLAGLQGEKLIQETNKIVKDIELLNIKKEIDEATKADIIEAVRLDTVGRELANTLAQKNIDLAEVKKLFTEQEIERMEHKIYQDWVNAGANALGALTGSISKILEQFLKRKGITKSKTTETTHKDGSITSTKGYEVLKP